LSTRPAGQTVPPIASSQCKHDSEKVIVLLLGEFADFVCPQRFNQTPAGAVPYGA